MSSRIQYGMVARVEVIEARGLRDADAVGKSDPFATVKLDGSEECAVIPEKFKTEVVENSLEPSWNACGHFLVQATEPINVKVKLWDQDTGGDDELGEAEFLLTAGENVVDTWLELQDGKGEVHLKYAAVLTDAILNVNPDKSTIANLQARILQLEEEDRRDDAVMEQLRNQIAALEQDDASDEAEKVRLMEKLARSQAIAKHKSQIRWIPCNDLTTLNHWADVVKLSDNPESEWFIGRAVINGNTIPGKVSATLGCYCAFEGAEQGFSSPQILVGSGVEWVPIPDGITDDISIRAVGGGFDNGVQLFVACEASEDAGLSGEKLGAFNTKTGKATYGWLGEAAVMTNPHILVVKMD